MPSTARFHTVTFALLLMLAGLSGAALTGTAEAGYEQIDASITGVDDAVIDFNVCKPQGASAEAPVPVIMHSHGWGGSASECSSFTDFFEAGFAVVSISQRGFGASGGEAHVHDPNWEGQDNVAIIDFVAAYDWIAKDAPGDPVMGGIGGSYGGGFQFMTALTEIDETGDTRFDAIAPEITWNDLPQSLAPQDVVRSVWVDALYAAGAGSVHQGIHEAFFYSMATGQLPDGSVPGVYDIVSDFADNSPQWFADKGHQLDIPVLIGQGVTDNLFNLNQGIRNYQNVLTDDARSE
ncbi:MAG: CocE/NonD family hydrolase, partial [Candidatus Thermoplasmatota archaeon]|nr:CocE/NonD family hydrolase [Candidatus Thermoplasmatota archaeon]